MKTNAKTAWTARLLAVLLVLMAALTAASQTPTASISGVVHDSTGAVVPQVKITLRNIAKGTSRGASSDNNGQYTMTNVEPGTYELRAERTGFNTEVKNNVILAVGGATQLDLNLQVGSTSEIITVTDEPPLIETSKAEVSNVITEQTIEALPNIGRNFVDFVKLSSSVAPGRENTGGGAFKEPDAGVGAAARGAGGGGDVRLSVHAGGAQVA